MIDNQWYGNALFSVFIAFYIFMNEEYGKYVENAFKGDSTLRKKKFRRL